MRAVVALVVVLACTAAHAQTCTVAQAAEDPNACSAIALSLSSHGTFAEAQALADKHQSGVVMRNTGIVLTLLGTALTIAGAYEGVHGALCDSCSSSTFSAGLGMFTVGQILPVAGIPLWVKGQITASHAERAMLTFSSGGAKVTF